MKTPNKTLAKYYTFTADDHDLQPTDAPFAIAEESNIALTANGFNVAKVTIVYIGTDDIYITNWNRIFCCCRKIQRHQRKSVESAIYQSERR